MGLFRSNMALDKRVKALEAEVQALRRSLDGLLRPGPRATTEALWRMREMEREDNIVLRQERQAVKAFLEESVKRLEGIVATLKPSPVLSHVLYKSQASYAPEVYATECGIVFGEHSVSKPIIVGAAPTCPRCAGAPTKEQDRQDLDGFAASMLRLSKEHPPDIWGPGESKP